MATRMTVLEIVRSVLNDMNGDYVNSISDTEESEQVAQHLKAVYRNLVSHTEWPHTRRAITLVPYSDETYPTHMSVNEEVKRLCFINYNKSKVGDPRKLYQPVKYLDPDHFLRKLNARDNTSANIDIIVDPSGIDLMINNKTAPSYYTSFDDVTLVFDSYDSEVEDTLQESKVQAQAFIIPEFREEDGFIPDLPVDAFSYLLEETTSRCQFKMRQVQDLKAEAESRKQSNWLSQNNFVVQGGIKYPNYGQRRR